MPQMMLEEEEEAEVEKLAIDKPDLLIQLHGNGDTRTRQDLHTKERLLAKMKQFQLYLRILRKNPQRMNSTEK